MSKPRLLVVYYQITGNDRNTINEHLYSFKKYSGCECFYLNAFEGVPSLIRLLNFDIVIYHYTFLSQRWNGPYHFKRLLKKAKALKALSGHKIALPQDEYVNADLLYSFFKEFQIDSLFTCLESSEYEKVYPKEKTGLKHILTTLTGYVDEESLPNITENYYKPHSLRTIDVGYRARKLPYWLGRHGTLKWRLTELFQDMATGTRLKLNVSNDEKDVFKGRKWYEFLANSRVVLGCEGGASLFDIDGKIREKVDSYSLKHPHASFEEVEEQCFKGLDGNLGLFAISPRHFEACMTKTCQVLVEGNYFGIFRPNVHYIELKKDFSNISEVLSKIEDVEYCEKMAERAFEDIIQSGAFTYRKFVKGIIEHCLNSSEKAGQKTSSGIVQNPNYVLFLIGFEQMFLGQLARLFYHTKRLLFPVINSLGLAPIYRKLRC